MNSKVTLARLSQLVADKNGSTPREYEDVLRLLFQHIAASLEGGENVKVKGLGTFKLSHVEARKSVDVTTGEDNEIPAHRKIVFIPCKELAAAVNSPFEMFETVVVEEGLLEQELMEAESTGNDLLSENLRQQIILEEEKADDLKNEYPAVFADSTDNNDEGASDSPSDEPEEADTAEETAMPMAVESEQYGEDPEENSIDPEIPVVADRTTSISREESHNDVPGESDSEDEAENMILQDKGDNDKEKHDQHEDDPYEYVNNRERLEDEYYLRHRKRMMWIWYIVAGFVVILGGLGILWWLNDDFAARGRKFLGINKESIQKPDSVQDVEIATLLDNEADMTEENTDMSGIVEAELPDEDKSDDVTKEEENNKDEEVVPTAPSDSKMKKPEYDTITRTRYLTTLAKQHYGNFHLWPYIYKENEKILGHPDRIRPGTKVVIPDLAKYGVDPKNPNDIAKAKKLGVEIYNRYK